MKASKSEKITKSTKTKKRTIKPYVSADDVAEIFGCGRYKAAQIIDQVSRQPVKDCDGEEKEWRKSLEGKWVYTSRDKRIPLNLLIEFCPNMLVEDDLGKKIESIFKGSNSNEQG